CAAQRLRRSFPTRRSSDLGHATEQAIELAREEGKHRFLHAFPSVDNAPSNAICRKLGFTFLEVCDFEFPPGNPLRCNDWRLNLRSEEHTSELQSLAYLVCR